MSAVGTAVDFQTAVSMWGFWFTFMLAVNGVLSLLVLGFLLKKGRDFSKRWNVLTADLEALTESLVPRDEKGRPIHAKLAENALKHYEDHDQLVELLEGRSGWFVKEGENIDTITKQIEDLHKWGELRATGEWCAACEITDCKPLNTIFQALENAREVLLNMKTTVDATSGNVALTLEEMRERYQTDYQRFYDFLMDLTGDLINSVKSQHDGSRDK